MFRLCGTGYSMKKIIKLFAELVMFFVFTVFRAPEAECFHADPDQASYFFADPDHSFFMPKLYVFLNTI
jgi:hypothetical protein